jgi:hypothetical protein
MMMAMPMDQLAFANWSLRSPRVKKFAAGRIALTDMV